MERRTIVFIDQVASTRILTDLGSEAMVPIRRRLWSIIRAAVGEHGGRVFSDEGDGGAAAFGSAEAAHAAALDITRMSLEDGIEIRVGLTTGSVVVNGDGFVGLAVHMAARLCDAAPPGRVLTSSQEQEFGSESTRRLTPFGQRSFKGFPEPVEVMLLTDPADDEPRLEDLAATSTLAEMASSPLLLDTASAFVGRESDVERLLRIGSEAHQASFRVALVEGEAGAGKSTLVHRVARSLMDSGALCLVGRGDDSFDDPFHEVIELLGHLVREAPVELLADHVLRHGDLLTRWLPGLGDRVPSAARVDDAPDRTPDRLRLYEAVMSLLRATSRVQPLVIVLEDLHWSTAATLDLVRYLLDDHGLSSVVVMATYRATEVEDGSPLAALLARQTKNERASTIRLEPLSVASVIALVETMHPELARRRPELVAPLAQHLTEATGGNALFCSEMLRQLDASASSDASADADAVASWLVVPPSVKELACHRVDRLGPDVAAVLAAAAVLGERFRLAELQRLVPDGAQSATEVLQALDRAERSSVIRPLDDHGVEWAFGHAVVHDALYHRLTTADRVRRHRAAADAIRSEAVGSIRAAEVLAHLTAAGPLAEPDDVWQVALLAADDATERLALTEAVGFLQRAVDSLAGARSVTPRQRATTVFALGRAQTAVGMAVGGTTMVAAAEIARDMEAWDLFAEIAVAYGGDLKENQAAIDLAAPVSLIEEALLRHTEPTAMRSRLLMSLALWQRQTMSLADRRTLIDEAMDIARSLDERRTLADVMSQHHRALHGPEVAAEALVNVDQLDDLAREFDDDLLSFHAMNVRVMTSFQLGDWDRARAYAVERADIGERLRSFEGRRLGLMWESIEANVEGRFADGDRILGDLRKLIRMYPSDVRRRFQGAAVSSRLWMLGQSALMYEMMPQSVNPDVSLAWFAADSQQLAAARDHLERSGGVARMTAQSDYMWSHDVVALTRTARALDDQACASELYDAVLPYRANHAVMGAVAFLGTIEQHLGAISATMGELDRSVEHYEVAAERLAAMRAVPYLALARAELASTLRRRGGPGDESRADHLAQQAGQVADELGLGLVRAELDR